MCNLQETVILVIPCYNEEKRLNFSQFDRASDIAFVFVNDGSTDRTLEIINKNKQQNYRILNLEKNVGKAETVRRGMLFAKTLPEYENTEWIGFWDADLATPLDEVPCFLSYCRDYETDIDCIYGSRIYKLGSSIKRSYKRHLLGRLFATVVGFVLGIKTYDSQCGAKLFRKRTIDTAFSEEFISKWIFDIEILMRLRNHEIIECPLRNWEDISGSKLHIERRAFRVLLDILMIHRKYCR